LRLLLFQKKRLKQRILSNIFLKKNNIPTERKGNNIWAKNKYYKDGLKTILLNSHHDTVKPVNGWTRDPFTPDVIEGKLYGLGANDAGGALVSLIATFCYFYKQKLSFNIVMAATAEEEISGANGIASVLPDLDMTPSVGIVGEPTLMQMAVAEKGLMVVDAVAHGKAGHAARNEGDNAIYKALKDIEWIKNFEFAEKTDLLGPVKMTVTQIEAGTQHNVVPDACRYVIDIRTNECYSNQAVFDILQKNIASELKPRSFRLNSSKIDLQHPLILRGLSLGMSYYGSPTLSDQALMPFDTLKIGPGDSARSHTADEYIYVKEINEGIALYKKMLADLIL
jgi:acetylornithine deacetylase